MTQIAPQVVHYAIATIFDSLDQTPTAGRRTGTPKKPPWRGATKKRHLAVRERSCLGHTDPDAQGADPALCSTRRHNRGEWVRCSATAAPKGAKLVAQA